MGRVCRPLPRPSAVHRCNALCGRRHHLYRLVRRSLAVRNTNQMEQPIGTHRIVVRVVSVEPNKMLGVIGEHGDMPIECLRQSHDLHYMATASHDSTVKFWNVAYLY